MLGVDSLISRRGAWFGRRNHSKRSNFFALSAAPIVIPSLAMGGTTSVLVSSFVVSKKLANRKLAQRL